MSKLIIEMEMPQNMCSDCEISIDGFACKKARTNGGKCPIVGVLPDEHGDLIDRDALLEKHNMKSTSIEECLFDQTTARAFEKYCIIADALEAVPTVIAAERKDDGTAVD